MSEILYPVKLRSGLRADALRRLAYARRCGGRFSHETDEKLFRYLSKMMRFSQLLLIVDILFKAVQLFYSQTA